MNIKQYTTDVLFQMDIAFDRCPLYKNNIVLANTVCQKGLSAVICNGDDPVAICTIYPLWEGVFNVQMILDKSALKGNKVTFIRGLRHFTDNIYKYAKLYKIKRLQTDTPDSIIFRKYMEKLGFQCEGVLRCFGLKGENHLMWSKIWKH